MNYSLLFAGLLMLSVGGFFVWAIAYLMLTSEWKDDDK